MEDQEYLADVSRRMQLEFDAWPVGRGVIYANRQGMSVMTQKRYGDRLRITPLTDGSLAFEIERFAGH